MSEPADSPQKRRQFGIICAVMAAALSYAVMTSGVMLPVEPTQGIFPGGNFCYKLTHRDYAASMGLGRRVAKDVLGSAKLTNTPQKEVEKILYHMYLDNPMEIGGRKLRWATGILVADSEKEKIDKLLSLNTPTDDQATPKRYPTDDEMGNLSATQVFGMLPYELADVPSVDALVVQFPHTHGFVSALVMSYKVRLMTHSTTTSMNVVTLSNQIFVPFDPLTFRNRSFQPCEKW